MSQFPRSRFVSLRRKASFRDFSLLLRNALAIGLAALLFLAPLTAIKAQEPTDGSKAPPSQYSIPYQIEGSEDASGKPQEGHIRGFIVEMGINGETTCRNATAEELPFVMAPAGASGEKIKVGPSSRVPERLLDHASTQGDNIGSGGLTINFNVLSQLANETPAVKDQVIAAFTKAAQFWTDRIKSPVAISIDIDYGTNRPGGQAFPSGVLGSTGTASVNVDYPGLRHNLIATSLPGSTKEALYNSLPTSILPTDTGNGGVVDVSASVARALGIPVGTGSIASIAFNKNFAFDFDQSDGVSGNQTDFVAVATHEIGHALGFTSGDGEGATATPTTWDLFRLRPGTTAATFTTAQRVMSAGGEQVFFTGQSFPVQSFPSTTDLGLSTGGPGGTSTGGDGFQSSHWKADELSFGRYIGIMDPSISRNVVKVPTENDYSALEAMGWDLVGGAPIPSAPPAPAPPSNDNFVSAQAITGCSGSVTGSNVGATKEAGEPNNPDSAGSAKSVWYQWQAPSGGSVTIDTVGSGFDTVLAVYTGSSLGGLALVGNNDDNEDPNTTEHEVTSSVTFTATQNTVYRIAVNGFNNGGSGGDIGSIKLNLTATNCTPSAPLVQLSQSTNTVSEGAGHVDITVTRTDSTSAATVNYATSDTAALTNCNVINGIASSRCDYATSVGTVRFAIGEASKVISIPVVDDNFTEGSETFTLTLSNPVGATLGSTTTSTVTITDNASTAGNPIDGVPFFVRQNYIDFLGREPDSFGNTGWQAMLNNCAAGDTSCDRIEVSSRFFRSQEFQERGYYVYRFYSASLGRKPNYEEFIPDVAKVSGFLTDAEKEANKAAFADEFVLRADFKARYDVQVTPT
ncbi:MAG TPA: NF038122 family metalloprotease, partial [Pyrinomonadaceae bacterium]|nr:NF038122 family metalloprotease [Pyrinomonadaceae bacterium]